MIGIRRNPYTGQGKECVIVSLKKAMMIFGLVWALSLFFLLPAQAFVGFNEKIPVPPGFSVLNACTGEFVEVEGFIHVVIEGNITPNGKLHVKIHINRQGISGVGQTSQLQYRGTGATTAVLNLDLVDGEPIVFSLARHVQLISQGPDDNLFIKLLIQYTVNANGDEIVDFTIEEEDCR